MIDVPEGMTLELRDNTYILVNEKSKDVRERIKTFSDAYNELGENHPYCIAFDSICQNDSVIPSIGDVYSYLKLRIICAALNEGWEPKFTKDEYRHYPLFKLLTKEEIDNMNAENKGRVFFCSNGNAVTYGGLVFANAGYVSSLSDTGCASRLVFKSLELAEYAGRQFVDIWADFVFKAEWQNHYNDF